MRRYKYINETAYTQIHNRYKQVVTSLPPSYQGCVLTLATFVAQVCVQPYYIPVTVREPSVDVTKRSCVATACIASIACIV